MAQLPGGIPYIRSTDLADPTLAKLNGVLAQIYNATTSSSSSTGSDWVSFGPTFGGTLTLSAFVRNEALYQHVNAMLFLNVDVSFTIAGSANSFTLTYPTAYPPATVQSYGDVLGCVLTIGGAVVPVLATVTNGVLLVQTQSGSTFAAGAARMQLTGFYRTSS